MKRKWIVLPLVAVIAIIAYFLVMQNTGIEVEGYEVQKGNIKAVISETGVVMSKSQKNIAANTSGQILQIKKEIGDTVQQGDTLLMLNMEVSNLEIKGLQSKLSGLEPSYTQAMRSADNSKSLYEQGALSYESYQEALTEEKELASQISELRYSIKQLQEMRDYGTISAPQSGIITEMFVKEGDQVQDGSLLIEVTDLNDLYIKVDLLTNEANQIKENAKADIYSDDLELYLEQAGTVEKIHPKAHTKVSDLGIEQKRVTVEIFLDNIEALKLGYDMDVDIITEYKENILVIPRSAIFEKNQKQYVYVIKDETAQMREIETGIKNTDKIEVINGLENKEQIILSPSDEIEEGSKVKAMDNE